MRNGLLSNYLALIYSVENCCPPERSFAIAEGYVRCEAATKLESAEMVRLRDSGIPPREIARMYDLTSAQVRKRIYRYRKAHCKVMAAEEA